MRISAVLITKNEEARIRRCLDGVKGWVDEIIVVDDESTDRTADIAKADYGAKVIVRPLKGDFASQRNAGADAAKGDWIFQLDADEVIPPQTAQAIREALSGDHPFNGFKIMRRESVFDRPLMNYLGSDYQLRIFRKGFGRNVGPIHEDVNVAGEIGTIQADIWHFNVPTVQNAIEKNNFYTELESREFFERVGPVSFKFLRRKIVFKSISLFYKHYIKNRAYRDGPHGLIKAVINTLHPMLIWLKVLERAIKENKLKKD